jgi:hypothetical protein
VQTLTCDRTRALPLRAHVAKSLEGSFTVATAYSQYDVDNIHTQNKNKKQQGYKVVETQMQLAYLALKARAAYTPMRSNNLQS